MSYFHYQPYVPVARRRANAAKAAQKDAQKGVALSPGVIGGRTIATTFWGKAWCKHLESFSDYENRLPRGRTYVRNGAVIDLKVLPGRIEAQVMGSSLYKEIIEIEPLAAARWQEIKQRCAGGIDSLVDLLKGRLSDGVMQVITDREHGLFPKPSEIDLSCSCPDSASLCKHLAAVLYGVGARLDAQPELLFVLRCVDYKELIDIAAAGVGQVGGAAGSGDFAADQLGAVFGIEIDSGNATPGAAADVAASLTAPTEHAPASTPALAPTPKAKTKPKTKLKAKQEPKPKLKPKLKPKPKPATSAKKLISTAKKKATLKKNKKPMAKKP